MEIRAFSAVCLHRQLLPWLYYSTQLGSVWLLSQGAVFYRRSWGFNWGLAGAELWPVDGKMATFLILLSYLKDPLSSSGYTLCLSFFWIFFLLHISVLQTHPYNRIILYSRKWVTQLWDKAAIRPSSGTAAPLSVTAVFSSITPSRSRPHLPLVFFIFDCSYKRA